MITFFQAIIIGILQGITELFPISSLGHSVLLTDLFGWRHILEQQHYDESFFLVFLVALHCATAIALLLFYWREWVKIIQSFFSSIIKRQIKTTYQKMAWLIIVATIPAGLVALIFEGPIRENFTKPMSAAMFLFINGFILLAGDRAIKARHDRSDFSLEKTTSNTSKISLKRASIVGTSQVGALFAGISRSGVTMVGGLFSGLDHEDAARFSFLLATPIILAAGLYKLPTLAGPLADGARPQIFAGALAAGIAAYLSVKFLDKYFKTKSLMPFAIYCLAFGGFMVVLTAIKG